MERYLIDLPAQRILFACQVLVFLGATVLAARPRWRVRFLFVCALALTGYVVAKVYEYRAPPSNYCHYYLGAKYRIAYQDFYRVVIAGRGEPLMNVRNLRDYRLDNNTPEEAREYFARLLDQFGVRHRPDAGWQRLMQLCDRNGLFPRHGRWFLDQAGYSRDRQRRLAADLRVANVNVRDCGFNGSPFYVLARQFDPSLQRPLSIGSYRLSALVEMALLALASVLLAKTFRLGATGMLLGYLIILAAWDYYDWVLTGLPGMLWYLPVAGALFFLSRERYVAAGLLVAVAALLKIFPGLLLLPALVSLAVGMARRQPVLRAGREVAYVATALVAGAVLALVAQTQMDWIGWIGKIRAQFMSGAFFAPNDIAFAKTWHHAGLGFPGAASVGPAVTWAARALLVAFLVHLFRRNRSGAALAAGGLASLTMMPWISLEYLQYYTFPIALTLVFFYERRRSLYYVLMPLLLVNQALVDFPHAAYVENIRFLVWPKTLYYYAAPLLFLAFLARQDAPAAAPPAASGRGRRRDP